MLFLLNIDSYIYPEHHGSQCHVINKAIEWQFCAWGKHEHGNEHEPIISFQVEEHTETSFKSQSYSGSKIICNWHSLCSCGGKRPFCVSMPTTIFFFLLFFFLTLQKIINLSKIISPSSLLNKDMNVPSIILSGTQCIIHKFCNIETGHFALFRQFFEEHPFHYGCVTLLL